MGENGFTLIEILVVVLLVGILAALALPTFLDQPEKSHDANAKADMRNAVSQMEACFAQPESYGGCPDADHPLPGDIALTKAADGESYVASKISETGTTFTVERSTTAYVRSCTPPGDGGCRDDGSW